MKIVRYLKARIGEKSTWLGVAGAATTAAVVPEPWSWLLYAASVLAALTPEKGEKPPCPPSS